MTAITTPPRRAWVQQIMGLPISIHLRGPDLRSARTEAQVDAVFASLRHADAVFSTYRTDSEISRWERGELTLAEADPALHEVLELCEQARELTGGFFDVRSLPDPIGPGLRFDPSGLVKGWAVQRAARHLAELDEHGWCLNAGGDVLLRTAPGHPPWRVGIEDPTDRARVLRVFSAESGAIATSGTARRGVHIIDPHTEKPVTALRAVTVVGPSLLWADVYATAAAARGLGALGWLNGVDGYEALVVDGAGVVSTTSGWS